MTVPTTPTEELAAMRRIAAILEKLDPRAQDRAASARSSTPAASLTTAPPCAATTANAACTR